MVMKPKRIIMYGWPDCPVYWQDFLMSLHPILATLPDRPARIDYVNDILKKYHGTYTENIFHEESLVNVLLFEDESYYNWFVIQWGSK